MHLLIVEDEKNVADQLKELLEHEKYHCTVAYNYRDALDFLDNNRYDLILLDWNLPDGDGLTLLRLLREEGTPTPVLMLSAHTAVDDKVSVLNAGGDDYLCKPYSNIELFARIRALLRRESGQKHTLIKSADLTLNSISREVYVGEELIHLSPAEFEILELLMQNKNIVLTRYQINDYICQDYSSLKQSNLLDVHIKNLRKKIGNKEAIHTVRGVGYTVKD